MIYIELKNGYKFSADTMCEEVNAAFEANLRFDNAAPSSGQFTAMDIIHNFTEENLGLIKVYSDASYKTVVSTFSVYKYLKYFSKTVSSGSGTVCSMNIGTTKTVNPENVALGQ